MSRVLHLVILITETGLIALAPFDTKAQSQNIKLAQNSKEQNWIAIDKKSSPMEAASFTQLGHNNISIVNPKSTEVYFAQVSEAILTQFIKLNPNDPNAYFDRDLIRTEERNFKGAEADYTQVIRLKPNDADAYNRRGLLREALKNYRGAQTDFTQVIKLFPDEGNVYINRGLLCTQLKNYSGAETVFTQAIELSPDDADGYYNRGTLRNKVKNYSGAKADLQRAAQLDRQQNKIKQHKIY